MRAKDLKLWDLFTNSNGYVCIVYRIYGGNVYTLNTNTSRYKIKRDSDYVYKNPLPLIDGTTFWMDFPQYKYKLEEDRTRHREIYADWLKHQKMKSGTTVLKERDMLELKKYQHMYDYSMNRLQSLLLGEEERRPFSWKVGTTNAEGYFAGCTTWGLDCNGEPIWSSPRKRLLLLY